MGETSAIECACGGANDRCEGKCSGEVDRLRAKLKSAEAGFCEAHQPPHSVCPCCEAVHADDERKIVEAALAVLTQREQQIKAVIERELDALKALVFIVDRDGMCSVVRHSDAMHALLLIRQALAENRTSNV